MKTLGKIVCFIGLYIVWSVTFGSGRGGSSFGSIVIIGVVGLAAVAFGSWITHHAQVEEAVGATPRTGGTTVDALYLRPFDLDGKFLVSRSHSNLFSWDLYDRPGTDTWERILTDALQRTAVLRGLGAREDREVGPRLSGFVPDWQKEVSQAIDRADYIFIIPSANPGTLWEIGKIKDLDSLRKTAFIMPPTCFPFEYQGRGEFSDVWASTVEACQRQYALHLPGYNASGMLFRMKPGVTDTCKLQKYDPRSIARYINRLMQS